MYNKEKEIIITSDNKIYNVLGYNGIYKLYNNIILRDNKNGKIIEYQWFRPQLIRICNNLNIETVDKLDIELSNNKLCEQIKKHQNYRILREYPKINEMTKEFLIDKKYGILIDIQLIKIAHFRHTIVSI